MPASGRPRQQVYLEWDEDLQEYRLVDSAGTDILTSQFQGSGGVANGDKGDITVSNGGNTWTLNPNIVSANKFQTMATASVLGRNSAGTGNAEVLSMATLASMIASDLSEVIDDRVAALLVQGANVTLTYDDVANTLTIASTGGGGGGAANLDDLGDVVISAPSSGHILRHNGTNFVNVLGTTHFEPAGAIAAHNVTNGVHGITAAAATVLDDATVAAMVDTLGGAASTGTGGLARAAGPTLSAPIFTGIETHAGASILSANAMAALDIDVTKVINTKNIAADSTFTFSAVAGTAGKVFYLLVTNTDAAPHLLTMPSCFNIATGTVAAHVVVIQASGRVLLQFRDTGTQYELYGDPGYLNKFDATTNPTVDDDIADGYGPGSLWLNSTGNTVYICESSAAGAAVWHLLNTGAGGGVADGDKGDITVSASGATWTIDPSVVTYAKMQNVSATDKLLGRSTAGAGVVEEIACTAAGRAILDDVDAAAQRTTLSAAAKAQAWTVGNYFNPAPVNATVILRLKSRVAGTITEITGKTSSGTCTVQVRIDGVNVTGGSVNVTSTEASSTCTAANTVSVGQTVDIVISAASSPVDLAVDIGGTFNLA